MTADIEAAVHYGCAEPPLATGGIRNSGEVAERLSVAIEEVTRAVRSLADTHGEDIDIHVEKGEVR
jgi:hypothetical protein